MSITIDPSTIVLTRPTPWNRLAEMVGDLRAAGATVTVTVGDETVKSLLVEAAQMDHEATQEAVGAATAPEGWAAGLLGARGALLVAQHRGTRWLHAARRVRSQMRRYGVGEAEIAPLDEAAVEGGGTTATAEGT